MNQLSESKKLTLIIAKALFNAYKSGEEFTRKSTLKVAASIDYGDLGEYALKRIGKKNVVRYLILTPFVVNGLIYSKHLERIERGRYRFNESAILAFKIMSDQQLIETWHESWETKREESIAAKTRQQRLPLKQQLSKILKKPPQPNKFEFPFPSFDGENIALPKRVYQKLKRQAEEAYRTVEKQIEYLVDQEED